MYVVELEWAIYDSPEDFRNSRESDWGHEHYVCKDYDKAVDRLETLRQINAVDDWKIIDDTPEWFSQQDTVNGSHTEIRIYKAVSVD